MVTWPFHQKGIKNSRFGDSCFLGENANRSDGHVARTLQDQGCICKAPWGESPAMICDQPNDSRKRAKSNQSGRITNHQAYNGHVTSILDVAKRAGVSPTTAKRAVRAPHLLTQATLERVQQAITDLNYEPDRTAGALRRGHSHTIGLIVGNIIERFSRN
jgi:Bacterial regulatory proteins, lacI family